MRRASVLSWFALGVAHFSGVASSAWAIGPGDHTPCGTAIGIEIKGLVPVAGGLVYDSNQGLCWLAAANLAGDPLARALITPFLSPRNPDPENDGVTLPHINPDGTMDYETALNWVNALNLYNSGQGWLGHRNWQLPTTIATDTNCSSKNGGNFGVLCKASALANLYSVGLGVSYPNAVPSPAIDFVFPFFNLQPGIYWSGSSGGQSGFKTFSFNTGDSGSNTTDYNFLRALPVTEDVLGPPPSGLGTVLPYTSGPAAGKAVYDSKYKLSWPLNANLAAADNFGFTASVTLTTNPADPDVNHTQFPLTVPTIDKDGGVHFSALCAPPKGKVDCPSPTTGWIVSMNSRGYAGSSNWRMPQIEELQNLYADMNIVSGDPRLESFWFAGPFWQLQPGFYWSCERDAGTTNNQAPCDLVSHPGFSPGLNPVVMEYSFNFANGFLGTDQFDKRFYVMVYFPAASGR